MNTKLNRGFTLIELLVVIAIIGILSSVVLASLNSARSKGRDARRVSDLKQLQLALELWYDANSQEYPDTLAALTAGGQISVIPADPQGAAYVYDNMDNTAGGTCLVADAGACASYVIQAITENTKPSGGWPTDVTGAATYSCDQTTEYCVRP